MNNKMYNLIWYKQKLKNNDTMTLKSDLFYVNYN